MPGPLQNPDSVPRVFVGELQLSHAASVMRSLARGSPATRASWKRRTWFERHAPPRPAGSSAGGLGALLRQLSVQAAAEALEAVHDAQVWLEEEAQHCPAWRTAAFEHCGARGSAGRARNETHAGGYPPTCTGRG